MKKLTVISVLLLLVTMNSTLMGQTLKLTSPDGGEQWHLGSIYNITWDKSGITSGSLKITLLKGDQEIGVIANDYSYRYEYYPWRVGDLFFNVPAPEPGTDYRIKIRWQGKILADNSNHPFNILPQKDGELLQVIYPNGGEVWEKGESREIIWQPKKAENGKYKLVLYKSGQPLGVIARDIPFTTKKYTWNVGQLETGVNLPVSKDYKVKVVLQGQNSGDISDQFLEIKTSDSLSVRQEVLPKAPEILLTYPMGGDSLKLNDQTVIKWDSKNLNDNMVLTLELYQGDRNRGQIIRQIPAGQTSFGWNVGLLMGNRKVAPGINYIIRILIEGHSSFNFRSEPFVIEK